MADRQLKLIATFTDQGALKGLKVMNTEMEKTEQVSKRASTGMKGFGQPLTDLAAKSATFAGALGIVTIGFAKVYEQAKRRAELEFTADKFDKLSESIGTTSDALLGKMTQATGKMMSNAEQISLGSQIIDLGLAKNEEMVVRLSRVIAERGLDMQQVILTFANDSKMRLDALGLSVTDVDTRTKAFQETGMAYTDAFDLAVIEALEAKIELVGSVTETSQGKLARAEVVLKNVADEVRMNLVPALADAAEGFTLLTTRTQQLLDIGNKEIENINQTAESYTEYVERLEHVADTTGRVTLTQEDLVRLYAAGTVETTNFKRAIVILTEQNWKSQQSLGANAQTLEQIHANMQTATFAAQQYTSAAIGISVASFDWAENTFYANQAIDAQTTSTWEAYTSSAAFEERLKGLNEQARDMVGSFAPAAVSVQDLLDATNVNIGSPIAAFINDIKFMMAGGAEIALKFEEIKKAVGEGLIAPEDAIPALESLFVGAQQALVTAGLQSATEAKQAIIDELGVTSAEATTMFAEVGTAADAITEAERILEFGIEAEAVENMLMDIEAAFPNDTRSVILDVNVVTHGNLPEAGTYVEFGGGGGTGTIGPGGSSGGGGGPGFEQHGGMVSRGRPYIVGEAGPELFVPRSPGQIISNNRLAENLFGGGGNVTVIVNPPPGQDVHAIAREVARVIRERS